MRKILFATAAAAVLFAAGAASAGNDTTNNQLNINTTQLAEVHVNRIGAADLTVSAQAIGNSIAVETAVNAAGTSGSGYTVAGTHFGSFQINQASTQRSIARVDNLSATKLDVSSQSVGNAGSFSSDNGNLSGKYWQVDAVEGFLHNAGQSQAAGVVNAYGSTTAKVNAGVAFQLNDRTTQEAVTDVHHGAFGVSDIASLAAGNSLNFDAPKGNNTALAYQINTSGSQLANTTVSHSGFGGAASIGSTAIGNIASWTSKTYGAADGINFQTNTASLQKSVTNVNNASFGKVSVGAVAAGNIGNIGL